MVEKITVETLIEVAEDALSTGLNVQSPWLEDLEIPVKAVYEYLHSEQIEPLAKSLEKTERALRYAQQKRSEAEEALKKAETSATKSSETAKHYRQKNELLEALLQATQEPEGNGYMVPTRIDWVSGIRRIRDECLNLEQ